MSIVIYFLRILFVSDIIVVKIRFIMGLFDFFKKPKNVIPYEQIKYELDVFTKVSLAMPKTNNPFLLDDKTKHPIIFGFLIGAMNQIALAYKLNEKDKTAIYTQYLERNFAHDDEKYLDELVKYSNDLCQDEDSHKTVIVGELAMRKWRAGGKMAEYAPMGLIRLLND